jgi:RNA polymerase sigma factor (sigma-70 family)
MTHADIETADRTAGQPAAEDASRAGDELRAEIDRGRDLDRRLAEDLGRGRPSRTAGGGYAAALESPRLLAPETERPLIAAAQAGHAVARAQLVEACMPLIASIARPYRIGQVQRQELLQEGVVGLLRALERFDPDRGVPFWGYASWWVRQAMQQLVSELTRPVVLSDRALRHLARMRQAHHEALQRDGREPSHDELAERSGLTVEQLEDLLATERAPRSLEEPMHGNEGDLGTFGELLVDPLAEDEYERVLAAMQSAELHTLLAGLSDREREILRARFGLAGEEQSLREIGERLGLSAERIRQIEERALGKLASVMG